MTSPIPMLDLVRLHAPLKTAMAAAFSRVVDSGRFIGGPEVEGFETALARHVGAARAVGMSSGTDALLASLTALGVGPGDEVITTPYTFFATAGSIARMGATPRFVDIDEKTFAIDPKGIAAAVGPRTVGVVPVHLFGQCADMTPILALAEAKGLFVLEDAAQAIGATCGDCSAGTMGAAGSYSFFPAKNLGALGDGGAVVTDDAALADRLLAIRQHGARARYVHETVGGNFRLDALQAALLAVKLPLLSGWEAGRRRIAARYADLLADTADLTLPEEAPDRRHVFNQYVIRSPRRDAIQAALTDAGIGSAVYYPAPLHLQACFAHLGHRAGDFPASEAASGETLALPMDPLLKPSDQERIAATVKDALDR